jgi:hypothetical protein
MIESITGCVASDDRTDHRMRVDGLQLDDHRNESGAGRRLIVWALQISNEPASSRRRGVATGEFTAQGSCVITDKFPADYDKEDVQYCSIYPGRSCHSPTLITARPKRRPAFQQEAGSDSTSANTARASSRVLVCVAHMRPRVAWCSSMISIGVEARPAVDRAIETSNAALYRKAASSMRLVAHPTFDGCACRATSQRCLPLQGVGYRRTGSRFNVSMLGVGRPVVQKLAIASPGWTFDSLDRPA